MSLRDAYVDLVLGGSCLGCGRPGRLLCAGCGAALPERALPAWPTPSPPGLVAPYAAAAYDGVVKEMVVGLKERQLLGLTAPLGDLLSLAVAEAVRAAGERTPVVLVPVPSRPSSVRSRGYDSTWRITRAADGVLRRHGFDTHPARLLRTRAGLADQAGLDSAARAANLSGALTCPTPGLRRLARRVPHARAVVCDDVLTTGATAREAQRALEAVGVEVIGIATVAATHRRDAR